MYFGTFALDKEKDMLVAMDMEDGRLRYRLLTPNHHTGNLITNLARLCGLPLSEDENGLKVIEGEIPCYVTATGEQLYIFRLGGTKVANIFPDGHVEMKAAVPAIAKTLMSQTKDYRLDITKTIVKTYILRECKFRTDLHTHMNANLAPDVLIALGIMHQIRYPLYYIKKLGLRCTPDREKALLAQRSEVAARFSGSTLTGKYLDRKIDDNTFVNFAQFLLEDRENAAYNIPRIRASLAVLKDGQAVFSNLEKVYLYRYVFTKGTPDEALIDLESYTGTARPDPGQVIPDRDIRRTLLQMIADHRSPQYRGNSLFQDKLLWIARSYRQQGVRYAEISDTTLVKKDAAAHMLAEVHAVMPAVIAETGVTVRFLAGIRRIPLTIVKDNIAPASYLAENLQVLRAVAADPYVAGSDILGEEINDIRDIAPVIRELVSIAGENPGFVIRIHAGENDSLRDNVANSIRCVLDSLRPGQPVPPIRIGHGLYTSNLRSPKGRQLLSMITSSDVTLEFQISSNVRLNNLSIVDRHPLREYLKAGVRCVQGTDGGALYGTDTIDEELALERLLGLTTEELLQMRGAEDQIICASLAVMRRKQAVFDDELQGFLKESDCGGVRAFYAGRIRQALSLPHPVLLPGRHLPAAQVFDGLIRELPRSLTPVIVAGGSFNNDRHRTVMTEAGKCLIDRLLACGDPEKICFIIGHECKAYERYLLQRNAGRFAVFAFVPAEADPGARRPFEQAGFLPGIRVAIEPSSVGIYKSIAYEAFKQRPSILIALDGNSAALNLMQEAKNAKNKCRIYVNPHAAMLAAKAKSLRGYVTMLEDVPDMAERILSPLT